MRKKNCSCPGHKVRSSLYIAIRSVLITVTLSSAAHTSAKQKLQNLPPRYGVTSESDYYTFCPFVRVLGQVSVGQLSSVVYWYCPSLQLELHVCMIHES